MGEIKLTKAQTRVLQVIQQSVRDEGRPPTRAEIADTLGFRSINASESHLRALERRGAIRLQGGASRGIQCLISLNDQPNEGLGLPVVGRVAAGVPIDSVTHIEKMVPIQPRLFSSAPDFLLRVQGESMIDIGIFDGDLLAVRKSDTAKHGEIVVARINGEVTVKRFDKSAKGVRLLSENQLFEPILVQPGSEFFIEGLAVGVIRTVL
ncbi:MAG TPA: LexA repressor [Gammaproteobacteria bacterium]|nr:LexA repressor [Gammaproteobacteria bacterium]